MAIGEKARVGFQKRYLDILPGKVCATMPRHWPKLAEVHDLRCREVAKFSEALAGLSDRDLKDLEL